VIDVSIDELIDIALDDEVALDQRQINGHRRECQCTPPVRAAYSKTVTGLWR
jgi:hypothetical protein